MIKYHSSQNSACQAREQVTDISPTSNLTSYEISKKVQRKHKSHQVDFQDVVDVLFPASRLLYMWFLVSWPATM